MSLWKKNRWSSLLRSFFKRKSNLILLKHEQFFLKNIFERNCGQGFETYNLPIFVQNIYFIGIYYKTLSFFLFLISDFNFWQIRWNSCTTTCYRDIWNYDNESFKTSWRWWKNHCYEAKWFRRICDRFDYMATKSRQFTSWTTQRPTARQ